MSTIKICSKLTLALLVTLFFLGGTPELTARTKTLRLAVPWPPGDPVTVQLEEFTQKFNSQAEGKYKINIHPAESLLKIGESIDSLRMGVTEMAGWPIGMFGSLDERFAAAEVPFLANNAEADAEMQVELMPLYNEFMEKKFNSKFLFTFTCVGLDIASTKPIKTASDWKGLIAQSVSPQSANFIKYMTGSAVPLPFPEGYQAIQKGVVDATMQSSSMMIMFKLNEVADYVTRGYMIPASLGIAINMKVYKKMPRDIQNLIVEVGKQQQLETNAYFCDVDKDNTRAMESLGMEVYHVPKAEREKWRVLVQPYVDKLYDKMGPSFASRLQDIADKANAKYPYSY